MHVADSTEQGIQRIEVRRSESRLIERPEGMLHIEAVKFIDSVSLLSNQLLDAFEFGEVVVKRTCKPDFVIVIGAQSLYPSVVIYAVMWADGEAVVFRTNVVKPTQKRREWQILPQMPAL